MAYKNSAGAFSAKQEFYNWNYFSQGMTKLGEAKGVQVNIKDRLRKKLIGCLLLLKVLKS